MGLITHVKSCIIYHTFQITEILYVLWLFLIYHNLRCVYNLVHDK